MKILTTLLAMAVLFASCTEKKYLDAALGGFDVEISINGTGGDGSATNPFEIPDEVTVTYRIRAFSQRGQHFLFSGPAGLRLQPGEIISPSPAVAELAEGVAEGTITARRVYGAVALWVEDIRETVDTVVEGGSQPLTQVKRTGSFASGVSAPVYFKQPDISDIQYAPWLQQSSNIDDSALPGIFADVDCSADKGPFHDGHGQVVVTGVFNEGFFVTDLSGNGKYNHLYVYNYSYPEGLEVGYRLDRLAGSTQDFSGCTQISFPSWKVAVDQDLSAEAFRIQNLDEALPPVVLTSEMCLVGATASNRHLCGHSKQNWTMEEIESARVRLENLRAPDVFVDCDFNGDGSVVPDWLDASHPEAVCSVNCLKHDGVTPFYVSTVIASAAALADIVQQQNVTCPWEADIPGIGQNCRMVKVSSNHICSELTTMRMYGQWVVALDDGAGPLINLITNESLVDYDPAAAENLGRQIPFIQGNLQQVRAARPRWLVMVGRLAGDTPQEMK